MAVPAWKLPWRHHWNEGPQRVGSGQPRRSVAGHFELFESLPKIENHVFLGLESVPLECPELQWQLVVIWRRDAQLSVAAQKWQELLIIGTGR